MHQLSFKDLLDGLDIFLKGLYAKKLQFNAESFFFESPLNLKIKIKKYTVDSEERDI